MEGNRVSYRGEGKFCLSQRHDKKGIDVLEKKKVILGGRMNATVEIGGGGGEGKEKLP